MEQCGQDDNKVAEKERKLNPELNRTGERSPIKGEGCDGGGGGNLYACAVTAVAAVQLSCA